MPERFELACARCGDRKHFPTGCAFGLDESGAAHLLATPSRDAERLLGIQLPRLKSLGRLRPGFPTVCLDCGHLGAHRADSEGHWACENCGSASIYRLGTDLRGTKAIGGALLFVATVVLPATSSLLWSLPGLVTLLLYLGLCDWLVQRGNQRLASAPCSECGTRALSEHRVTEEAGYGPNAVLAPARVRARTHRSPRGPRHLH